jgi:hypothetical protein
MGHSGMVGEYRYRVNGNRLERPQIRTVTTQLRA